MTKHEIVARLLLAVALLAVAIWYALEARSFSTLAQYAPIFASGGLAVVLIISVGREATRFVRVARGEGRTYGRSVEHTSEEPLDRTALLRAGRYALWFVVFLVAIDQVGMTIAACSFVGIFLVVEAHTRWWAALIAIGATLLALWFFGHYVELIWPRGSLTGVQ